eukprot:TRINITY_DN299_c0_g1_i2.p1 TRINITY_DN299_c0_g1~~TRINITY_DN299_c0_g1_i2.p1  ORF type:complete len:176 (-),score=32.73 TRINITY_DN299_c0_g1_i2:55-546(-)
MHHGCSIHSKSEGDDSNNAKEAGTCIDYNNLSASVLVKFDNVKRPVSMKKSKVQASCKIGVPKDFMLTDDLLKVFELFLIPPDIDIKIPEPPKKKEEPESNKEESSSNDSETKKDSSDPFKVDNEWACSVCTLHNVGFHPCDVCGSPCPLQKPKTKKEEKRKK